MNQEPPVTLEPKLRFGWLLVGCLASVVFCGLLVWLMGDVFSNCCDLSWLGRFIH